MADPVPASEFTQNFERFRRQVQREAIAVSDDGSILGYFIGPAEYQEFQRFKRRRSSFATTELCDEKIRTLAGVRMDECHAALDDILEPK